MVINLLILIRKKIKLPSYNGKTFTKANLHELLNELIVERNESEDNIVVTEDVIDNNESISLVNSTTADKINPGDIRNLMYTLVRLNLPLRQLKRLPENQK